MSKACSYGTSLRPAIESVPGSRLISRENDRRSVLRTRQGLILRSARVAGSIDTFCEQDAAERGMDAARRSSPANRLDDRA